MTAMLPSANLLPDDPTRAKPTPTPRRLVELPRCPSDLLTHPELTRSTSLLFRRRPHVHLTALVREVGNPDQ